MLKQFNLKNFIIASLRKSTYRYPPRYNCMNAARTERGKYKCALCSLVVGRKEIKVDHIEPVVGPEGFIDWNAYVLRMFPDEKGFQALCYTCHKAKTKLENHTRKLNRLSKLKKKKIKNSKKKNTIRK
jgi:5-methylcytosine-specific restriction endonuclease McrA